MSHDLVVRAYQPEDDPYLMQLERLCPRGEPRPFVHFRRRFVDRAMLFDYPYVFVAEKDGLPVGVTSIAIKETYIGNEPVRVAYSFDTRVHPDHRRQGIANAMQEEKLAYLQDEGVHGMYALVVATNVASIKMLEKMGLHKQRLVLHLTYTPYPLLIPPAEEPYIIDWPDEEDQDIIYEVFSRRDMFYENVEPSVANYNYQRVSIRENGFKAGISIFDQSLVYQQIPADEPWPSEDEVAHRQRVWRIFNEVGTNRPDLLRYVFDTIRDLAVGANVARLTWLIDRVDPVPHFVFEETSIQTDYWVLFRSLIPDWEPRWTNLPVYLDPRDV